ncbi:MAG: tyrosine-type recombinase/integrase [Dehalococcoidia bacterium]
MAARGWRCGVDARAAHRWPDTSGQRTPSAPESIRRRLTGVLAGWREHGLDYPRGITANARRWVDDYHAKLIEHRQPTGRGKAAPLTVAGIRKIVTSIRSDTSARYPGLAKARDIALVLMAFSIAGRQSELAFLDVDDIEPHESGMYVHVRRSKTGARKPKVKFGDHDATCPVLAWRRWQEISGITEGAAFRTVSRHGHLGGRMSGDAVSAAIGRAGKRAGVEAHLTGHSARRGLATEARRAGGAVEKIADQGGWKRGSTVLLGYIDDVDGWSDNVLAGIGL